ncbi:MAG: tRNA (adenosine(37)-N6)-dimethylallyltransferase MiaA, partial [Acidobacteriota bacterium]
MNDETHKKDPLLICVIGPTASGKSALALRLAANLCGEIVNCDSMQMVKDLEIG